MRKSFLVLVLFFIFASLSWGQIDRTLYTRENRFPDLYRPEIGVLFEYKELDTASFGRGHHNDADMTSTSLYGRFQVLEGLTLDASLPYNTYSSDHGPSHSGVGDITVGASFLAFEDVFDYPYVIPHASYTFDTGDEDKYLGRGETYTTVGISVGTVTHDIIHWIADASYRIRKNSDNSLMVSGSLIWDVSDEFSVLGEARYVDQPDVYSSTDSYGIYYTGGLIYSVNEKLTFGVYGTGATKNTEEDVIISIKAGLGF